MIEKRSFASLLLEVGLILGGILVSLYFQKVYEDRARARERLEILQQLRHDLSLDTAQFSRNIRTATYLMDQYTRLLTRKGAKVSPSDLPEIFEGVLATDT